MTELDIHEHERTETGLPAGLVKKIVAISLVFGLAGGAAGSWLFSNYGQELKPQSKTALVRETSAIIEVAKKVSPSVVSITVQTSGVDIFGFRRDGRGAGTGIIVSSDGLILTNKHVVSGAGSLSVFTSDGKEYKDAKVVAVDSTNDIAFVRIEAKGLTPAELGDSAAVIVGQKVVAIGNALGQFQNSVTEGIISGLGRPVVAGDETGSEQLENLFQTDAAINPGNSGGPLVNLDGQVIGINTAIAGDAQNIGFAIPINEAVPLIDSVKATGKISRPFLGVRYIPITKDFAARNNLSVDEGAYVTGSGQDLAVIPASPAAKAGLREGDIITKVGSDKIDKNHSLTALVAKHKIGVSVTITFLRDGKQQTASATLEEAKSQ